MMLVSLKLVSVFAGREWAERIESVPKGEWGGQSVQPSGCCADIHRRSETVCCTLVELKYLP